MEENKVLDELQFIRKIVEDSKRTFVDNGMGYIIWGFLIFIGMLLDYIEVMTYGRADPRIRWAIIIGGGWIWTFAYYYRSRSKQKARTFVGRLIGQLWLSVGICMTIIGFAGTTSGMVKGIAVSPLISVVLGMAYYLTGVISNVKLFRWVSLGWWLGALVMMYKPGIHNIIIMAGMMLFLQMLPGLYLYRKAKQVVG